MRLLRVVVPFASGSLIPSALALVISIGGCSSPSATPPDAHASPDAHLSPDAGRDVGPRIDAWSPDGNVQPDADAHDAGPTTPDMGVLPDAGTDAGSDAGNDAAMLDDAYVAPDDAYTPCTSSRDCGASQLCLQDPGDCLGTGYCVARPETCSGEDIPVCGCDGLDYANSCAAAQAGTGVDIIGMCPTGGSCSLRPRANCCFGDSDCAADARCVRATCSVRGEGVCKTAPAAGRCWDDADCGAFPCTGAQICGCGASCFVPDSPGFCTPTP